MLGALGRLLPVLRIATALQHAPFMRVTIGNLRPNVRPHVPLPLSAGRHASGSTEARDPSRPPVVPPPSLSIAGTDLRFPVRRVYCVGSNYREHALEMGSDPDKSPPFFFMKPGDAAVDVSASGAVVNHPPETEDLQHEVEMVVALGTGGRKIPASQALQHIFGYGVGVDLTRRDMQNEAKKAGRPWDCSKGFDKSGPVGVVTPTASLESRKVEHDTAIWLKVNGTERQHSKVGAMVWSVPEMISRLSEFFTLEPGDILFTGTPAGVSRLEVGDHVEAGVGGLKSCSFQIGPPLPPTAQSEQG